jgi:trimethylamine--corrinoid protein Co-methyltransferase
MFGTPLRVFNKIAEDRVIQEALMLLEDPGIIIQNQKILEILEAVGVHADFKTSLVKIPSEITQKALDNCPDQFSIFNRDGNEVIKLGTEESYYAPGSSALTVLDRETQNIRPGTTSDLVSFVQLTEMLIALDAQSTAIVPSDIPVEIADFYRLFIVLTYSSKPVITGAFQKKTWQTMYDLLLADSGGKKELLKKPRAIFDVCPKSPLMWGEITSQNLLDCSQAGIPVQIVPMPLSGATAPVTLAGTIIQHTAECLSGIVITQMINQGAPVIWGGSPAIFDMKSGTAPLGAAESWLLAIGYAQIGKALGLPTQSFMGVSDSKLLDAQAGLESSSAILAALTNINLITGAGMLALENCQSLEKLVFDAEVIQSSKSLKRGILLREQPLALDLVQEIGHKGDFLSHPHTLKWFKEEINYPTPVINRQSPQEWDISGSPSTWQQTKTRVEKLINQFPKIDHSDPLRKELARITSLAAKSRGISTLPQLANQS